MDDMTARRRLFEVEVELDARIPTADRAVTMSADVYRPRAAGSVPALVTVLPYRKDLDTSFADSLAWFAARGYGCVLVDHVGIGSSDGVPHQPWSPGETDDAITAIEWAASQPWCDGNVGMWGISHGGFTAMRAATRRPPQLRAIIAAMNALDVERDIMHPGGARGDFVRIASWGGGQLLQQLLPPLRGHTSVDEQRRWQQRLSQIEPFILQLARMGPGHPAWRDRVIDPAGVGVPTFCVAGWQDIYPDAVTKAFEEIQAPKKLLIGPWGHTLPHECPIAPVDFLPIALRWWDHWLRGSDDGVLEDPPVTIYIQGSGPGWRSYDSWPITSQQEFLTATAAGLLSTKAETESPGEVGGEYRPDPTIGALAGLRGIGFGSFGLPQDQHDDDTRSLTFTSESLDQDLLVAGCPEILVELDSGKPITRLVARLTDVDPCGRSRFVTSGVISPTVGDGRWHRIVLAPAVHRIGAGCRVRVTICDADFPRLRPVQSSTPILVRAVDVRIPTAPGDAGSTADVDALPSGTLRPAPAWTITRDAVSDDLEVAITTTRETATSEGHRLICASHYHATVSREAPHAARLVATHSGELTTTSGNTTRVTVTANTTHAHAWIHGHVTVDGVPVVDRTWDVILDDPQPPTPSTPSLPVAGAALS